jgi:micrococcal nuclease
MTTMVFNNVRLVKVVDGDTVRLDVDLGFNTWRLNEPYRLARVNAPEMGTNEGWHVKMALITKLTDAVLNIMTHGKDKYGRWLIELFAGDGVKLMENINDWLLNNELAVPMNLQKQLEQ